MLRTVLAGAESLVEVTDFLPHGSTGRIIRRARVLRGPADIAVEVVPGPGARDVHAWSAGVAVDGMVVSAGVPFVLRTAPPPAPARPRRRLIATAHTRLGTGEELVVTIEPRRSRTDPLSPDAARRLEERAVTTWRRMGGRAGVAGRYGPDASRSALVVAALSGIAGGPVEAPVTSLPRLVGGERNRDGRHVSPATAAAWAETAAAIGLTEESEAATRWLVDTLAHEPPLPAALAPDGGMPGGEATLRSATGSSGMPGWRRSQPVVSGSDAGDRRSAEPVAAAIAACAHLARGPAGPSVLSGWSRLAVHADWIADHWADPDASIWDDRGPDRSWTSPRLATRRALAAAVAEARRRNPLDLDAAGWQVAVRDLERWLRDTAVGNGGILRANVPGAADAALARVAFWGPWPADDPVTRATLAHIETRLGNGAWLGPYAEELDDGLPGTEPASVTATLWLARALATAGRWDEAHERMEAAATLAGTLHLMPESVDPTRRAALGNRPSASAHVAFIEAAVALASAPS
ncbi:MAG: glycoside hydrolase family 15 protein [Acidimicrobiales bacterium]